MMYDTHAKGHPDQLGLPRGNCGNLWPRGRRRGVADRLSRAACRLALSQIKATPGGWGENKWSHPGKNQTLRELNRTGIFGGPNF